MFGSGNGRRDRQCGRCDGSDTKRAIEAAEKAQPAWAAKTGKERAAILRKWFDLMMANQEELAILMTGNRANPLRNLAARSSTPRRSWNGSAEEAKRTYGDVIPQHKADSRIVVIKQPIGRCGDHAMELPFGNDHPQGGASSGSRQRYRYQTGEGYASVRAGAR